MEGIQIVNTSNKSLLGGGGVGNDCKTIAFPAISCGAYGFPIAEA